MEHQDFDRRNDFSDDPVGAQIRAEELNPEEVVEYPEAPFEIPRD